VQIVIAKAPSCQESPDRLGETGPREVEARVPRIDGNAEIFGHLGHGHFFELAADEDVLEDIG